MDESKACCAMLDAMPPTRMSNPISRTPISTRARACAELTPAAISEPVTGCAGCGGCGGCGGCPIICRKNYYAQLESTNATVSGKLAETPQGHCHAKRCCCSGCTGPRRLRQQLDRSGRRLRVSRQAAANNRASLAHRERPTQGQRPFPNGSAQRRCRGVQDRSYHRAGHHVIRWRRVLYADDCERRYTSRWLRAREQERLPDDVRVSGRAAVSQRDRQYSRDYDL